MSERERLLEEAVRYLWASWGSAEGEGQPEFYVFGPAPAVRTYYVEGEIAFAEAPVGVQTVIREALGLVDKPAPTFTCIRCGVDLSVPPHFKKCWHGVPAAKGEEKGNLCDPCHEEWEKESKAAKKQAITDAAKRIKEATGASEWDCYKEYLDHGKNEEAAIKALKRRGLA